MKKINVTIFSGGSGNIELLKILSDLKNKNLINLNLLINGYDDGKSTGFLRELFPTMLGPSDFRKNCENLLNLKIHEHRVFKQIISYRFKNFINYRIFIANILNKDFIKKKTEPIKELNWNKFFLLRNYLKKFNEALVKKKFKKERFKDISLGNIIFVGIYLDLNKNFNLAIREYNNFFGISNSIHNITNGQNLFLCGIAESGQIHKNEVEIIENKSKEKISEIFLIKEPLLKKQLFKLKKLQIEDKINYLRKIEIFPKINKDAINILKKTNILIYGTGTQNSSLFPSYLTRNLNEIIRRSKAKKIFISNILKDYDIVKESTSSIIEKFKFYVDKKNKSKRFDIKKYINYFFIHNYDNKDLNKIDQKKYLKNDLKRNKNIIQLDWEKHKGVHFSNLVVEQILKIVKKQSIIKNIYFQTVSIIIPCLNERKKLKKVLNKIKDFKYSNPEYIFDIILIDGGSRDGSLKIARGFKDIRIFQIKNGLRGECIDLGIQKSRGQIIITFPSDDEYDVSEIKKLIIEIEKNNQQVVYGSRLIKVLQPSFLIKKVYKNNFILFFLSKFGGILISIFCLIFYNRFVTDPLTSFKGFKSSLIKEIKPLSKGVDYDLEQFAILSSKKIYIHEVPVNYNARDYRDGKKTTVLDGLKCILILIKKKFFR
jgi:2-phospho-L-lactate transferase/gluconeogenesis factor (CofD/UPF0052 family)